MFVSAGNFSSLINHNKIFHYQWKMRLELD